MGKVEFSGKRYVIDGEPVTIAGGTLQFFRVPADAWKDRLLKMREAGLNTVDTYVAGTGTNLRREALISEVKLTHREI